MDFKVWKLLDLEVFGTLGQGKKLSHEFLYHDLSVSSPVIFEKDVAISVGKKYLTASLRLDENLSELLIYIYIYVYMYIFRCIYLDV